MTRTLARVISHLLAAIQAPEGCNPISEVLVIT